MEIVLLCGLAIIFALYLVPRLLHAKRYSETSYYKITKKPYSSLDAGERGEYQIFKALEIFENQGGKLLFNLYIPKPNDETTEIDVVLIHPKGFFVIESKNYKGWIFGSEKNLYWTQTLPVGRRRKSHKEQFYNPIRQNEGHIKYLKRILSQSTPMWSVIVFSDKCTFRNVTVSPSKRYKVIQLRQLKSLIDQCAKETSGDIFSSSDIQWMYDELYPFTQEDEEVKRRHLLGR